MTDLVDCADLFTGWLLVDNGTGDPSPTGCDGRPYNVLTVTQTEIGLWYGIASKREEGGWWLIREIKAYGCGSNTVCVDSYENGILRGWLHNPCREAESFSSLTQFLLKMEQLLDEIKPQAYAQPRRFSPLAKSEEPHHFPVSQSPRGGRATFDLQVVFRQNASWQGILYWREAQVSQRFRSVLELVFLMDSALRSQEGCNSA